jgi:hypothetical protein
MSTMESLQRQLSAALAEAHQVGDSPLRADMLVAKLPPIARAVDQADIPEDSRLRIRDALAAAERTLRRDDDGREAARHLQTAVGLLGLPPRKPSPFLDDLD